MTFDDRSEGDSGSDDLFGQASLNDRIADVLRAGGIFQLQDLRDSIDWTPQEETLAANRGKDALLRSALKRINDDGDLPMYACFRRATAAGRAEIYWGQLDLIAREDRIDAARLLLRNVDRTTRRAARFIKRCQEIDGDDWPTDDEIVSTDPFFRSGDDESEDAE